MIIGKRKRLKAFVSGMLLGSMVCTPVYAATSNAPADDIARDYPAYQEAPASSSEVNDAVAALNAGMSPSQALSPQPVPYRDYAAFMSDLWDLLFQTDFQFNTSSLHFDSWIADGTGSVVGTDEAGHSVGVDVLFTLETPQNENLGLSDADMVMLQQTNARFGIAWAEVSTVNASAKLFGWWMQLDGADGVTGATFIPVTVVDQESWSGVEFALPFLLDDIGSIWNEGDGVHEPVFRGSPWSRFKNAVRSAARVAAVTVGVAVVVAVVAAAAPIVAGAATAAVVAGAVTATTSLVGGCVVAAVRFEEQVDAATDDLRDAVDDDLPDYIDVDSLTDQEIVEIAQQMYV